MLKSAFQIKLAYPRLYENLELRIHPHARSEDEFKVNTYPAVVSPCRVTGVFPADGAAAAAVANVNGVAE